MMHKHIIEPELYDAELPTIYIEGFIKTDTKFIRIWFADIRNGTRVINLDNPLEWVPVLRNEKHVILYNTAVGSKYYHNTVYHLM